MIFRKPYDCLKALTSGRAEKKEAQRRLQICRTCPHIKRRQALQNNWIERLWYLFTGKLEQKEHCGKCGCGAWPLANLRSKSTFKEAKCPIGKWGEPIDSNKTWKLPEDEFQRIFRADKIKAIKASGGKAYIRGA